jgi:hypothetical protein
MIRGFLMSGTTAPAEMMRLALARWLDAKAERGAVVLSPDAAREVAGLIHPRDKQGLETEPVAK